MINRSHHTRPHASQPPLFSEQFDRRCHHPIRTAPLHSLTVAAPWWGSMPNCGITCGFDTCTCTSLFEPGEVTGWPSLCDTYRSIFLSDGPPRATQNAHSCAVTSRHWTSQLGNWVQSHTGNTPCPYSPTHFQPYPAIQDVHQIVRGSILKTFANVLEKSC